MDFTIPKFVAYIAAWFGIMGGIWALFDRAEIVLHVDIRKRISNWLDRDTINWKTPEWPSIFISIFDRIFGEKHISWKCFFRSCIASVSVVLIMTLITYSVTGYIVDEVYFHSSVHGEYYLDWNWVDAILFLFVTLILNVIPDYFSLLETRWMLNWMLRRQKIIMRSLVIIIDLLLTAAIFLMAFSMLKFLIGYSMNSIWGGPLDFSYFVINIIEDFISGFNFWDPDSDYDNYSIWIYSTFFTSIWIWVFVISSLFVKVFALFGFGIKKMGRLFDIEDKPLRSIGFVGMILVTLIFVILPFF